MSVDHIAHLDKEILFLNSNLTLLNIFLKLNPEDKNFYAYSGLAIFKFRNKDTKKHISATSGREKIYEKVDH